MLSASWMTWHARATSSLALGKATKAKKHETLHRGLGSRRKHVRVHVRKDEYNVHIYVLVCVYMYMYIYIYVYVSPDLVRRITSEVLCCPPCWSGSPTPQRPSQPSATCTALAVPSLALKLAMNPQRSLEIMGCNLPRICLERPCQTAFSNSVPWLTLRLCSKERS